MLFVAAILAPICMFRSIVIQFKELWLKIPVYSQKRGYRAGLAASEESEDRPLCLAWQFFISQNGRTLWSERAR